MKIAWNKIHLLVAIPVLLAGCKTPISTGTSAAYLENKWGVQVVALRRSAGGYMLDFRYKVLDAKKAAPLADRRVKPYLIDEATQARFMVPSPPKVGPLRQAPKNIAAGKNYFILFANPGKVVKPGDLVTVVIGDFKAEHLVVE